MQNVFPDTLSLKAVNDQEIKRYGNYLHWIPFQVFQASYFLLKKKKSCGCHRFIEGFLDVSCERSGTA